MKTLNYLLGLLKFIDIMSIFILIGFVVVAIIFPSEGAFEIDFTSRALYIDILSIACFVVLGFIFRLIMDFIKVILYIFKTIIEDNES